jgi:hypothetical protein
MNAATKKVAKKKVVTKKEQAPAPGQTTYQLGDKPYNPKVEKNARTWERIRKRLEKGPATHAELLEVCQYEYETEDGKREAKHTDFIGYMERGKHIVRVTK